MTPIEAQNSGLQRSTSKASGAVMDPVHCIYFYYLHFPPAANRPDIARVYEYFDIDEEITDPAQDPAELLLQVKKLAVNAVMDGKNPPKYAEDIKHLNMDRRSYFVVVVDATDKQVATSGAIVFKGKNHKNKDTDGKHTFVGEVPLEFEITLPDSTTRTLTGVCYTNMMFGKKDDGGSEKLKKGEWEDFSINLTFRTMEFLGFEDSGGTNMGPPVPPPSIRRARSDKGV